MVSFSTKAVSIPTKAGHFITYGSQPAVLCALQMLTNSASHHQSPLYLLIASIIPLTTSRITASIIYTLSDYLAALSLRKIWSIRKWQEEALLKRASDGDEVDGRKRRWLRDGWEDSVMLL